MGGTATTLSSGGGRAERRELNHRVNGMRLHLPGITASTRPREGQAAWRELTMDSDLLPVRTGDRIDSGRRAWAARGGGSPGRRERGDAV